MKKYNAKDPERATSGYLNTKQDDVKKVILSQHAETLKGYARKAVLRDESLTPEEGRDREIRMREYLAIGRYFGLTENQLVAYLYKGFFNSQRMCDCPSCRAS